MNEESEVEVTPKLEERSCVHCGAKFKAMMISRQLFCSNQCAIDSGAKIKENVWAGLNRASLEEKKWNASDTARETKTRNSEPKKMPVEKNGPEEIRPINLRPSGPIIDETKSECAPESMKTVNAITQPVASLNSQINLREEISASMNLCRHTARHLFGLMRDLNPKASDRDTSVRLLEQDRCRTAAELGKQTISAMRMQLDIIKLAKELASK